VWLLLLHDMYLPLHDMPFLHRPLWSMGDMPNLELHPVVLRSCVQTLSKPRPCGRTRLILTLCTKSVIFALTTASYNGGKMINWNCEHFPGVWYSTLSPSRDRTLLCVLFSGSNIIARSAADARLPAEFGVVGSCSGGWQLERWKIEVVGIWSGGKLKWLEN
jgi:hypothetical protein